VVRSANTGISGFIDPLGRTTMRSGWYQGRDERSAEVALDKHSDDGKITQVGTQLALSQTIYLNQYITIYNRLGDGKILSMLLLSMLFLSWFNRKQERV
jgi:apolipoprotein N-acyltransferase